VSGHALDLKALLCCPRCRSPLDLDRDPIVCANAGCLYAREGFPQAAGHAGAVGGAGKALVWSIRYVALSLGMSTRMATLAALPFFWVRFVDRFARTAAKTDAASGVYFFGRRSEHALSAKDMPHYYEMKR
jgi:hypothetical protein